jgi:hypothetical protein
MALSSSALRRRKNGNLFFSSLGKKPREKASWLGRNHRRAVWNLPHLIIGTGRGEAVPRKGFGPGVSAHQRAEKTLGGSVAEEREEGCLGHGGT